MLFTAASFTVSTVGTIVSILGLIRQSGSDGEARLSKVGWSLLVVVGVSYLLGMFALLSPESELPQLLRTTSTVLPAALLILVGVVGTLNCSYFAFVHVPAAAEREGATSEQPRWRRWAVAGVVLIPLATAAGAGYYLLY